MTTTERLLARVCEVGPYFHAHAGPRPPDGAEGFRPLTMLYGPALREYTGYVAARLNTAQERVAASTVQLGVSSRLWSIGLASAVLAGRVPDLDPAQVWWRVNPNGPLRLWLPEPRELPADALLTTVAEGNLRPLGEAVRKLAGVSPHTLRGNAASALVGALRVLIQARPDHAPAALECAGRLLQSAPLRGSGAFRVTPGGHPEFRRRSCCLYYRVPGAGTCGDCVLRERTATTTTGRTGT